METRSEGMTGTKGEEGNVFESEGGKRANEDNDSRLAKRVKVEGESSGVGTKEEEGKVERLRGLLADDPKKLSKKDVEEVINCLNVEEIISLALEARQGKGSDDDDGAPDFIEGRKERSRAHLGSTFDSVKAKQHHQSTMPQINTNSYFVSNS